MAYYTYEQLVNKINNGEVIYFVNAECDIIEFSFDGHYNMTISNLMKVIFNKELTEEEFNERFTYYVRHFKIGGKK